MSTTGEPRPEAVPRDSCILVDVEVIGAITVAEHKLDNGTVIPVGTPMLLIGGICEHGDKIVPLAFPTRDVDRLRRIGKAFYEACRVAASMLDFDRESVVYCPGPCGRRLYGPIKARGGCEQCSPEIDDETIARLTDE